MEHRRLAICGSTNDEARAAFEAGASMPLLISAAEQTAGRGRQGRVWSQLRGNFAGSFLIEATRVLRAEPGALSLLAGLAIKETLVGFGTESDDMVLKWPNDVLLRERKVAGVLAEMVENDARRAVILGIGVNLAEAPRQTVFPAAAVFKTEPPDPKLFGDRLGEALLAWIRGAEDNGTGDVLKTWRTHAWRLGETLAIRQGERVLEGIFEDIDRHGHLLLRSSTGEGHTITAGDTART